jgi:DNA polymerase-4
MSTKQTQRKIIHIDMDAFFASVEQRDFPELRGKPIAVGGGEHRGVTTTASYEARVYGVKSAMPGWKAKQLCPQLIFVKPRFQAYKEASDQIQSIFLRYTDLIEPLSLDEAFLDVSENKMGEPLAMELAKKIKEDILKETALSCSAGISYCKFLAKVASDLNKPNGLTLIHPEKAEKFLEELAIEKFYGVGKVTAHKMHHYGIFKGADLKNWSKIALAKRFGKVGLFYYDIVRGIDNRPVKNDRKRKSLGIERTLDENISDTYEIENVLTMLVPRFYARLKKAENFGRTITLKIKTGDFQVMTRSRSKDFYICEQEDILEMALELLKESSGLYENIRLLGLSASNLQKNVDDDTEEWVQLKFDL